MTHHRLWFAASIFLFACSSGGSASTDGAASGGSSGGGSGGASGTGSGGSSGGGTGGANATGSGGATTGTGGAMAGSGGTTAGTGGTMMGTGGTMTTPTGQSVTQRNGDPARTGAFVRPAMTKAKAATLAVDAGFNATFKGDMTGTPLYLENGPGGKGAFYIATQSNDVYAFDETTGAQLWTKNAGATATGACDNQGKGAMATPAIDAASRTLFVAVANGPGKIQSFKVHAYNVDDGSERAGWPVDIGQAIGGGPDLSKQNQRGALLLVNGILYVPFGGQVGDCGGARGRIVAINIADPTKTGSWATGDDGSTIWGQGGAASDGTGIYTITGNHFPNFSAPAQHADSEEVVRLTGLAQLTRNNNNIYFPNRWSAMDSGDLDFGSNSASVFDVPGAAPGKFVVAPAKDGHLYFLDAANLGGMGGEKVDLVVSASLFTQPATYQTAKGTYVSLNAGGAHCPGGGGARSVMGILVSVNAGAINPAVTWCAADSTATSPIVTTTDGKSDPIVWFVSGDVLKGVDGDTGMQVYSGGACAVQRWTAAIAAKGARIVAAGAGKLCSWSAM